MTIRTKRRGRRSLAAILAAMLMASVLSVVAGAPAQAANTSGEHWIDTDGDGIPNVDERQFDGEHRYITAQMLADAYAANAGSPSTVIIASGETEVDAVTAAGLAGKLNAPLLLTRSSMLPHNVRRYINHHNITDVIVVGGTAAVSDTVVTEIEALGSRPKVERISGADRYATAAAIGDALGGPNPTWCGSDQSAALLVNGGDAGRADAIAAGPLANALSLPVLLTTADELPQATVDFLTKNKVERVVVLGGSSAVSDSVRTAMREDIGVSSTPRISGGSAAATSVMLAKEMLGNCKDVLNTDPDRVALVNRSATADGIAAAPAMGYGLGNGPIPILLVDDTLPAAVSDYLASTAEERGGQKTHLSIVAIGGTAVVSKAVMDAAVAAAKTSPELTATIGFNEKKPKQFSVTYSDDVKLPTDSLGNTIYLGTNSNLTFAKANGTAFDPTLYEVNGRRIEGLLSDRQGARVPETQVVAEQIHVEDRTVVVTLSHELKTGDVISVIGGDKIGANGDRRPLESASHTVGRTAPAVDRTAPTVEIVTGVGQTMVSFFMVEEKPLVNAGNPYINAGGVTIKRKGATTAQALSMGTPKTNNAAADVWDANRPTDVNQAPAKVYRYDVSVPGGALAVGDVIQVARNTFRDIGNRGNSLTRFTVAKAPAKLEISRASIGNPAPKTQASVNLVNDAGAATMTVTAKATGAAKGASGNGWVIYGLDASAGEKTQAVADIDVDVDMKHRIITYTVNKRSKHANSPTLFEVARAMTANEDFKANFSVTFISAQDQDKSDKAGDIDAEGLVLSGGSSQVAVRVQFNQVVNNSDLTLAFAQSFVGVAVPTGTYEVGQLWASVDDEVNYTYTTCTTASCSLRNLPQRLGSRVLPVRGASVIWRSLSPDASLKPFNAPYGPSGVPLVNSPPVFDDSDPRSVAENGPAIANVGAPVSATDPDQNALTYVLGGTDVASFTIDASTGQIKTKASLDHETKASYEVEVSVSDGHAAPVTRTVAINVTDVNEHGPVFTEAPNTTRRIGEIAWDRRQERVVRNVGAPVSATDGSNDADTLRYSFWISESDSAGQVGSVSSLVWPLNRTGGPLFTIDAASGQIKTVAGVDYDYDSSDADDPYRSDKTYSVTVRVSDGRSVSERTATIPVAIILDNTNEPWSTPTPVNRRPTFSESVSRSLTLAENTVGSTVGDDPGVDVGNAVTATDVDGSDSITGYMLSSRALRVSDELSDIPKPAGFRINSSGQIKYTGSNSGDFESNPPPIPLWVIATGGAGDRALSEIARVTVTLSDVDEAPVFTKQTYAFTLAENSDGSGEGNAINVGTVMAVDPDKGATVTYAFQGDGNDGFAIDADTGKITFTGSDAGNYETDAKPRYTFNVKARGTGTGGDPADGLDSTTDTDSNKANADTDATVTVTLTDVLEKPGRVSRPNIGERTATAFPVTWSPPEGADSLDHTILHYNVRYAECTSCTATTPATDAELVGQTFSGWTVVQSEEAARHTFRNLKQDTIYRVQVQAVNADGAGQWSVSDAERSFKPSTTE